MTQGHETFIPVEDLYKNFKEVIPPLSYKQTMDESNRCLFCYDAPCTKACPTHIDVPFFIKKIATGNLKGSARVIMEANPIGATCARVCPTEELCEGACVLGDQPIMIGQLQRYATDWAIKNNEQLFRHGEWNGQEIAVIGGGPAGLSAARELARLGYRVTIFEAKEKAGGTGHLWHCFVPLATGDRLVGSGTGETHGCYDQDGYPDRSGHNH